MALGEKTKLLWQNPEYRRHMSEAHKGKPSGKKGKITPLSVRMKLSKSRRMNIGKLPPPNWKGGICKDTKNYHKEWCRNNQDRCKLYWQKRRSLERGGGKLSIKTIQLVYEDNIKKYGTLTCYLCLKPIEFKKDHLEHKIPLSRGGTNEYSNLAIACNKCNFAKKDKTIEEYKGGGYE